MSLIAKIMFLLFFPACLGLLRQVIWGQELMHRVLALGTLLFCIDQARMAVQDLQQIADAKQVDDIRLDNFYTITTITIFIELLGFYTSSIWWGWGSIIILLSQLWFNLLVKVKIQRSPEIIVQEWTIRERLPVLIADIVGIILVSFWMLEIGSRWIAGILFAMVIVYGVIKFFAFFRYSNVPNFFKKSGIEVK
jgi:hypothetical protein